MRKSRQVHPLQIRSPIPAAALPAAAALWWGGVGPGWPRQVPEVRASHGIVALDARGEVQGVAGLRDGAGGFPAHVPLLARLAFRAAPATADLVIDGIVVREPGQGVGRLLIEAAGGHARAGGHPGLRVEVAARNHTACAFYRRLGFAEIGRGRYGWPWSGEVLLLRRPEGA
ncbi:GNAT family N-acetyltransferase [Paracoccus marinaquae]|uniref:GNAT family N-acetyltransferase n=1 Tax=Paracoccus marinaquae TaxID=2841926 RepID=A0ABS6AJS1_9RHOB|nr:GNAT family N-acetyltransferase [Paracoccus marinaquae]MBU3029631.1 GNAT family N-acetyltransferase [Paracoccus marinaquae]